MAPMKYRPSEELVKNLEKVEKAFEVHGWVSGRLVDNIDYEPIKDEAGRYVVDDHGRVKVEFSGHHGNMCMTGAVGIGVEVKEKFLAYAKDHSTPGDYNWSKEGRQVMRALGMYIPDDQPGWIS